MRDRGRAGSGGNEVDRWIDSEEWRLALILHQRFCRRGHEMHQCWGLQLPYDLAQPKMSQLQRHYIAMARALMDAFDSDQINLILTIVHPEWLPDQFPEGPKR